MNKNIIKIGVPVLVLFGIIAIILATSKSIDELSSKLQINSLDFGSFVDGYISDSIVGQSNSVAMTNYNRLYEIITTESAISVKTQNGSDQLLGYQEAEDCYARAFSAYFPIFANETEQIFSRGTWNDYELNNIKKTSQQLKDLKGTASASDSLNNYIGYVGGYYEAVRLIGRAKSCAGADSYKRYCDEAKQYIRYPYKNNSKLSDILSEVSGNAKKGWMSSITNVVNTICNHPNNHWNSYPDFYNEDYLKLYNKIDEYDEFFGASLGSALKPMLNKKDSDLKNYFYNNNN